MFLPGATLSHMGVRAEPVLLRSHQHPCFAKSRAILQQFLWGCFKKKKAFENYSLFQTVQQLRKESLPACGTKWTDTSVNFPEEEAKPTSQEFLPCKQWVLYQDVAPTKDVKVDNTEAKHIWQWVGLEAAWEPLQTLWSKEQDTELTKKQASQNTLQLQEWFGSFAFSCNF